jgi:DNA-binding transcriptional LysR family regulator
MSGVQALAHQLRQVANNPGVLALAIMANLICVETVGLRDAPRELPLVSVPALCCSTKMKSENWNWSDLRVFLAVLDAGSTLAASRALGMAQPTVARRIDALEHATGLTLFERDTRGRKPTQPRGSWRRRRARWPERLRGSSEKAARTSVSTLDRPIRLTAPKPNFSENLAKALADFTDIHPGVRFELIAVNEYVDLMAGEADVAIRFGA